MSITANRVNEAITASRVKLISSDGKMLGLFQTVDALKRATDVGMDLVEILDGDPPTCKILDWGKHLFDLKKKEKDARNKSPDSTPKEIQCRPVTDEADMIRLIAKARGFLKDGRRVQIKVQFIASEQRHPEMGKAKLERFIQELSDASTLEGTPSYQGKSCIALLAPIKGNKS